MFMKNKILLFIPAYQCEAQITRVLNQLTGPVLDYLTEIAVFDNRSEDGTVDAALRFKAEHPELPLKVFRNKMNYGLGGSQKSAFSYAIKNGFDYVCMLHGDDQGAISDFLPVFSRKLYLHYDCVLGARFMPGSRLEGYSTLRTIGNVVYNFLFAAVIRRRVFDLGSGLNLYAVRMLENGFYKQFPDDLTFNYSMVLAMGFYHHKARFFPISWREEDQRSNVKLVSQAAKVLRTLLRYFLDPKSILSEQRERVVDAYEAEELF